MLKGKVVKDISPSNGMRRFTSPTIGCTSHPASQAVDIVGFRYYLDEKHKKRMNTSGICDGWSVEFDPAKVFNLKTDGETRRFVEDVRN